MPEYIVQWETTVDAASPEAAAQAALAMQCDPEALATTFVVTETWPSHDHTGSPVRRRYAVDVGRVGWLDELEPATEL